MVSLATLLIPLHFTLQLCEPGTHCSECMETIPLTVTVNPGAGTVRMAGRGVDGGRIIESMENCAVVDRENWSCEKHSRIEAKAGRVAVTVGARWAADIEACTTQEH